MDLTDGKETSGPDIGNLPHLLPDNCVEYQLFIIDPRLEPRKVISALDSVRKAALKLAESITKGYIWQRDEFHLEFRSAKGLNLLQGTTHYSDSVEDEWLVVFILRELTRSFPTLWIRVSDTDGEFLLIEAASVLPSWITPEIDANRVWIHQQKLMIIPITEDPQKERNLTIEEAVGVLGSKPSALLHSTFVEAEAFYRLEKYPAQIHASSHRSVITIPRKVAFVLHRKPSAIAPAVEAFYLREPASLKSLVRPEDQLSFPPKDLVTISVKFTKVLFAQLKSQRFPHPPAWSVALESLGPKHESAYGDQKASDRLEMGMKVTSGFEMLAKNAETKDSRTAREVAILLHDLEEDGDQALPNDDEIRSWPAWNQDDDESWMNIDYEDFAHQLDGRGRSNGREKTRPGDTSAQADLQRIVARFEAFLNDDAAGPEGAELDEMDDDDDDGDYDSEDAQDDSEGEDKAVSFDEDQFAAMMREMMGMPHAGKMPPGRDGAVLNPENEHSVQAAGSDSDDEEIRQLAAQMETELKEHGALKLDSAPGSTKALGAQSQPGQSRQAEQEEGEESGEDDVDVDYNLARNLLESFKSQAGMPGPAGNILSMMGMRLPRDDGEEEDDGNASTHLVSNETRLPR